MHNRFKIDDTRTKLTRTLSVVGVNKTRLKRDAGKDLLRHTSFITPSDSKFTRIHFQLPTRGETNFVMTSKLRWANSLRNRPSVNLGTSLDSRFVVYISVVIARSFDGRRLPISEGECHAIH